MSIDVRLARGEDAQGLLRLQHKVDRQTSWMLLEPGERVTDVAQLERDLSGLGDQGSFVLVAVDAEVGAIVGWLSVDTLSFARARHVGYVVIGVDGDASGRGVGTALMSEAVEESRRRGLHRLELTVVSQNARARSLYERVGFVAEGTRKDAIYCDGRYWDETYMGHLLA